MHLNTYLDSLVYMYMFKNELNLVERGARGNIGKRVCWDTAITAPACQGGDYLLVELAVQGIYSIPMPYHIQRNKNFNLQLY